LSQKVLQLNDIIMPDQLGCEIARYWHEWDMFRQQKKNDWREIRKYVYATDTQTTSNNVLPWKNTTTIPKLTQIFDNLRANYMASMFPNAKWLQWEGSTQADETRDKVNAIKAYMLYVINQRDFKTTIGALVDDYILHGNTLVTPEWRDDRVEQPDRMQTGYVGPIAKRLSPWDTVFNPTSPSVEQSPKIVRSIVTLGDLKELIERQSQDEGELEAAEKLFAYLMEVRRTATQYAGDLQVQDDFYYVDGFSSFRHYLSGDYAEVLTFYGDLYDRESGEFLKNHIIQVVDRHKIIRKEPNPTHFGYPPIFHTGWRTRPDNLWAMGPLDNLIGMQYRIDHIENLKADLFDLTVFPPLKIKGYVEDFEWAPFERIHVGEEGDVELLNAQVDPLRVNFELQALEAKMEEMAGAPKEAMGFRTPGEKTAYEVQRLENAAARIFQSKIAQFEEQILEPLLNGMLELAQRRMDETTVRVIDDEYKVATFLTLTAKDITGAGRIRPMAARHFVERAERIQNLSNFFASSVGMSPEVQAHFSSVELARLFEELLDLENRNMVQPYIRLTEQAEAQQIMMQHEEDNMVASQQSAGMAEDDFDI
jgi:hypothetical protein